MNELHHEASREAQEAMSRALHRRSRIRSAFKKGWDQKSLPFIRPVLDDSGERLDEQIRAWGGGQIEYDDKPHDSEKIMVVPTDAGYVSIGKKDLMTAELTGCQAVLITGETEDGEPLSALYHLTPTSKLSWGNFPDRQDEKRWGHDSRVSAGEKIRESLDAVKARAGTLSSYLIRTKGHDSGTDRRDYSEATLQERSRDLQGVLEKQGVPTIALKPLDLEVATIYWSPAAPHEIYAVGEQGDQNAPRSERNVGDELVELPNP